MEASCCGFLERIGSGETHKYRDGVLQRDVMVRNVTHKYLVLIEFE